MRKDIAIKVENVSKTFRIPHEKITSMKGVFVNAFKKKTYEEFQALDNVSFEIKKGEFFGIIGRNGSGKSTLLKILAGIYQPDSGKVEIDGLISPFLELGIGFNPELSGRDNIYLNGTVLGLSKEEIDDKFEDIVRFSELERFTDQRLKNYSSGMKVRLAFSVAIHANRDILLMDEVLAVGDSNFQGKCLEEFNRYRDLGKTVLLVSHSIDTVRRYCDQAMLLREGKIELLGKPSEVGEKYIWQNMEDEEIRSFKDEAESEEDEESEESEENKIDKWRKDRRANVTSVRFIDTKGISRKNFRTGDDIKVVVKFQVSKKIKDFDVRVSLETAEGVYLFGYDTFADGHLIQRGEGELALSLKDTPLMAGAYFVNISCFTDRATTPIDFKPRFNSFKIFADAKISQNKGILYIKHEWK